MDLEGAKPPLPVEPREEDCGVGVVDGGGAALA